jgi:hypothetical protein
VNKNIVIGLVVLAGVLIAVVWLRDQFVMFEVQEDTLFSYPMPGKGFKIEGTRVATGATTSDVIQIRKVYKDGSYDVVENIDNYDSLIASNVIENNRLRLIVKDFGYANNDPDTVEIKIE